MTDRLIGSEVWLLFDFVPNERTCGEVTMEARAGNSLCIVCTSSGLRDVFITLSVVEHEIILFHKVLHHLQKSRYSHNSSLLP